MVVASVRNTGGRALDMSGTLQLLGGPDGLSAGPFPATLGVTLGIGETEEVSISLGSGLPDGPWDAHITLRSGLLERSAAATITFPADGASAPVPTRTGRGGPPLLAAAIALVLAMVAATLIVHRRHLLTLRAADPATPAVDEERTAEVVRRG
jgi:hypothetical protein